MDSKTQRKALFRSRLREISQKREKRIESPLVRYNEDDQPVCRVCNVTLKSESLWAAHQASRKHHEAIETFKAAAARKSTHLERQQSSPETRATSTAPADLFDCQDVKRQKSKDVKNSSGSGPSNLSELKEVDQSQTTGIFIQPSKQLGSEGDKKISEVNEIKGVLPSGFFDRIDSISDTQTKQLNQQSEKADIVPANQVKGTLPAGFFDNRDEDMRARGIEPVKVDINDAYKEFEKDIQEDLQGVDDRLEEEEIDAAEEREEIESFEQKTYRERVEMVKAKLLEAKRSRLDRLQNSPPEFKGKYSVSSGGGAASADDDDSSSGDTDVDEDDFSVDWRAKRF